MNTALPTLRSRILRSFLLIIAVYALLGFVLVSGIFIASGTTPRLLHRNYDSTAAADRMRRGWDALANLNMHGEHSRAEWIAEFETALSFEEKNITESGERAAVDDLKRIWQQAKAHPSAIPTEQFMQLHKDLDQIVAVNERAMFELAHSNENLSRRILIGAIAYFLVTLILAGLFANSVADRLAQPLKHIAEVLRGKHKLGKDLKLPQPTSLEVLILNHELKRLWRRLSETNEINVIEIVQQKKKLETVLDSIEDGLLVVSAEGRIDQCNQCFARLVGIELDKIVGQAWSDLSSMSDNYLILRTELNQKMSDSRELELYLDGSRRSYAARWRNIEPVKGQVTAVVFLLHDITEKRQRERLRSEIIDLLSHELRTPLQSLGTASELLSKNRTGFPEDLQLLVDTVAEDVNRIRAVAHEFVQVTQTHSKVLKLKIEKVPLNYILLEWLKPFMVIARDKKVKIEFAQEGSEYVWASADPVKFPWVISNLVSNAIRFSPIEGTVRIVVGDTKDVVEIRVEDEGIGVPPEDRARIFEPFFQSETQSPDANRGLFGVGLTIAKEVVEAHGGKIEYLPRSPVGSIFKIELPKPSEKGLS